MDTNTVSQLLRGHPNVINRVQQVPMSAVCISAITEAELKYGLARRPQALKLKGLVTEFLKRVDVLPWDSDVAETYGRIRAEAESNGKTPGTLDLLIAAHGVSVGAVVVTSDKAFSYVPDIVVEDWLIG
ncbi:type II toxin-antitoxin system VapC family toxin [Pseudomonas sp. KFB-139]|uniref:Type II toxin-antitoxin system VapC family toxin n=1 Tax=Pseudomonas serbiensis TaxID=3064350 RepID=A0ABT9CQK0_9PSED|nr:type II toxin-antitoxin system VapC family toxin [Pseudomonas sp. KFB-138]MDO7927761.1 type II toxin-antitoxin system VapC family toxin [Pseudomonas sp. KFB-138]